MRASASVKIRIFRAVYLTVSVLILCFTVYNLAQNILSGIHTSLPFKDMINIFALLFALLFEFSIVLFIVRSMRSQTLLMKHLVFKPDGTPFKFGVALAAAGGVILTALAAVVFASAFGSDFLEPMERKMQLFIADVTLIFGMNLLFTLLYFIIFRHESGTFEMI